MSSNPNLWLKLSVSSKEENLESGFVAQKRFFEVQPGTVISFGRKPDNTIHLPDSSVSGYHAKLIFRGQQAFLQDLGSSNGTHYQNHLIPRGDEVPLRNGERFEIVHFVVEIFVGTSKKELDSQEGTDTVLKQLQEALLEHILGDETLPPRLTLETAPHTGQTLELRDYGAYIVGRSKGCHFSINDGNISREHAQINRNNKGISIIDLESRNGVKLNTHPLKPGTKYRVQHGDQVAFGEIVCTLNDPLQVQIGEKLSTLFPEENKVEEPENVGIPKPKTPPPSPPSSLPPRPATTTTEEESSEPSTPNQK